jgi:phosphatidylglycerol:prolipoprotein diacylglycerol transferase
MWPELFKIPGTDFPVATYGVLVAAGFVLALWLTARVAERDGLPKNRVYDIGLYVLASGLIGSKLLLVITEWRELGSWDRIFSLNLLQSAGVYYGGFLIALAVGVFLTIKWQLPWRKAVDAFAPGVALGHAVGRVGCFSAGCCWGRETASWIGVKFTSRAHELTGVPIDSTLIPTQLIEAGANLAIFALLMLIRRRRSFDGQVMAAYLMLYGAARFVIEFWRGDERGEIFHLSTSQFISALMIPAGLALWIYYRKRVERAEVAAQPASLK